MLCFATLCCNMLCFAMLCCNMLYFLIDFCQGLRQDSCDAYTKLINGSFCTRPYVYIHMLLGRPTQTWHKRIRYCILVFDRIVYHFYELDCCMRIHFQIKNIHWIHVYVAILSSANGPVLGFSASQLGSLRAEHAAKPTLRHRPGGWAKQEISPWSDVAKGNHKA